MDEFLRLGHTGSVQTTLPSLEVDLEFEGYESRARPLTFVDWVLENGVTEPRLEVKKFNEAPGLPVAGGDTDRRLLSDRYQALSDWMGTHQRVRPIDVLVAVLLFAVVALGTAHVLEPAAPTLPPLSQIQ